MNVMVRPSGAGLLQGGLFFIWLLMMGGMIAGWIIFVISMWRGMKAHESIAHSLQQIADKPN